MILLSEEEKNDILLKEIQNLNKKFDKFSKNLEDQFIYVQEKFLSLIQGGIGRILASQQSELVYEEIQQLNCNLDEKIKLKCWEKKESAFKPFIDKIEAGSWHSAYKELDKYEIIQVSSSGEPYASENDQCKICALQIQKQIKPVKELLRSLLGFFHRTDIPNVQVLQFTLDSKLLYDQVINPISNSTRLALLLNIFRGHKRFSELKRLMQAGSSVLDHHLTKLIENKFISKDSNNNYTVTVLGEEVLRTLTELSTKISINK